MPIISIGMPLRNSRATVARAIESVIAQQFAGWELIVIDDGSTDGTAEIVRRFADPRIRLVEHTENRGLATRLNEAVRLSTGEFFARMDGDDVMYPERLRLQHEFLQLHCDIDLVGGAVLVFRGDGVRLGMRGARRTHEQICARPWSSFPIAHPTWTGRTAWFRNHPYPEEMIRAQDQALLLRSFAVSRFATLGEIVLGYREERLTLTKVLRARYYAMLAHLRYGAGVRHRTLAIAKQTVAALVDTFALACRLDYTILRHRARFVPRAQMVRWKEVWAGIPAVCREPAGAPRAGQIARGKATPVHASKPLVSIVMPVWNCEYTVALAIASVLNQRYDNWELLVLDDGSSDRTVDIAGSTGDPRVRIFADGSHRTLPVRLNQGVGLTRGRYVARMDGDDVMYPERLARQVAQLTESPGIDLVGAGVLVFRNYGEAFGIRLGKPSHEELCSRPWAGVPLAHPTWFGRAEFFREFAYRDDVGKIEDQELLFRARHVARFCCISEILLGYRESRLRLGRMLAGRAQYVKMLVGAAATSPALAARGICAQTIRAAADVVACSSGLDYTLLRHRARPSTAEQVERWHAVWCEAQRTAASLSAAGITCSDH
jgi:glycosyltransferase involved in cell wall biosynthesis